MGYYPFGETVHRDRRPTKASPYNPDRYVPGEWKDATSIALEGAFVASSSSSSLKTATRAEVLTAKSLYLTDVDADVKVGDRIRVGGELDDLTTGIAYMVNALPDADVNPFTGFQPAVEIPLDGVKG